MYLLIKNTCWWRKADIHRKDHLYYLIIYFLLRLLFLSIHMGHIKVFQNFLIFHQFLPCHYTSIQATSYCAHKQVQTYTVSHSFLNKRQQQRNTVRTAKIYIVCIHTHFFFLPWFFTMASFHKHTHIWPLNNMDLNCAIHLHIDFFFTKNITELNSVWIVDSTCRTVNVAGQLLSFM